MSEIKEMNLFEKLLAIQTELGTVAKNLSIDTGKGKSYKAVSERDIIDAVKPLEDKYRVYSYPTSREIIDSAFLEKTYNGNVTKSFYLREQVNYRFVNVDKPSEYIDTVSYGDGIDTGDKATGKATTYADKYALMKVYKISTGEDADNTASEEYDDISTITAAEASTIQTLYTRDEIKEMLKRLGKKNLAQLTKEEVKKMIDARTTTDLNINDKKETY